MGDHRLPQCLTGTLICVLSGTNGIGCLTDKAREAVVNWLETSRSDPNANHPDEWVAELPVLLKRAGDPRYMSEFGGLPVSLDTDTKADIDRLHDFRNRFTHFRPSSWSIETTCLPQIMHSAMRLAHQIMFGHPARTFRLESHQLDVFLRALSGSLTSFASPRHAGPPEPLTSAGAETLGLTVEL